MALRFSDLSEGRKAKSACKLAGNLRTPFMTDLILDVKIRAVDNQKLGRHPSDVGRRQARPDLQFGHVGAGNRAGSGKCYIKFGAVQSGQDAALLFRRPASMHAEFAYRVGTNTLVAGVNLARIEAYREMLQAGFRTNVQGVAMERNGDVRL